MKKTLLAAIFTLSAFCLNAQTDDECQDGDVGFPEGQEIADYLSYEDDTDGNMEFNLNLKTAEIESLLPSGTYYVSYYASEAALNAGTALPLIYMNTTNPETIYVRIENEEFGCVEIKQFDLMVIEWVAPPSGSANQYFTEGETLADLEVDGEDIQWYDNPGIIGPPNGMDGDEPLPMNTLLTDGTTYYASQTIDGVESVGRFGVTANLTLGTADIAFNGLHYSPNPVEGLLTIVNGQDITSVTVFDILGQQILTTEINAPAVLVDFSPLNSGVYLVEVRSGSNMKTFKVIKQ